MLIQHRHNEEARKTERTALYANLNSFRIGKHVASLGLMGDPMGGKARPRCPWVVSNSLTWVNPRSQISSIGTVGPSAPN